MLPFRVANAQCSTTGNVVFGSPETNRPSFRIAIRRRVEDAFDVDIKVARSTISTQPKACGDGAASTDLATSFVLDDGTHPPLTIATVESWRCALPTLRASRDDAEPTPTPGPSPAPAPSPGRAVSIDLSGKASRIDQIGEPVEAASIRITGTFCGTPTADLLATTITFDSVLDEDDGAGELLAGVPLNLAPVGTTVTGVAFRCRDSGPSCWMEVKQLDPCVLPGPATGVRYEYSLKIDRSQDGRRVPITYLAAPSCAPNDNTELTTSFTIDDVTSLRLRTKEVWLCTGSDGVVNQIRAD